MTTGELRECTHEYEHLMNTEPDDIVALTRPSESVQCPHMVPSTASWTSQMPASPFP
jgi:hypothetical protein